MDKELPLSEICRYMGMGVKRPDAALERRIREIAGKVRDASRPATIAKLVDCKINGTDVRIGGLSLRSKSLSVWLAGCDTCWLFAATIGAGVDLLLRRWSQTSQADAVIGQAAGAALVEELCDEACSELAQRPAMANLHLRSRFSPGYGDVPLSTQVPFFAELDITRRIGISLNDSLLMSPSKSVTAFIGVGTKPPHNPGGCASCPNRNNCLARKDTNESNP